jgi:predicted TIM-barrel fold metal-dependent hydrolase
MDDADVDKAFLVQHNMYGDQNDAVIDALRRWPDRFEGFAFLGPLDQPDAPDQLERLIDAGMIGLKVEVASTRRLRSSFRFDGENEWRVWDRLNQLKGVLALDLIVSPLEDVVALRKLIDEFEKIWIVNCHVGGASGEGWQDRALLASHPRVWSDLAAIPNLVNRPEEYPFPTAQEFIRWTVDNIGADKLFWGTDYPPVLTKATYRQLKDYIKHCDFLTPAQTSGILGGNAERFLKLIGKRL